MWLQIKHFMFLRLTAERDDLMRFYGRSIPIHDPHINIAVGKTKNLNKNAVVDKTVDETLNEKENLLT